MLFFKSYFSVFFFCIFFKSSISENQLARARLFRNTYTTTVVTSKVVTSLVPSSCVQVEPTLPPCRNVRYLRLPKLPSFTFNSPQNQEVVNKWKSESKVETTPLGWAEYFGFYAPTVTVTATDLHISTVQDPSVVVTFAVKGCRPLKLPLDLDVCSQGTPGGLTDEMAQISTVGAIVPTKTVSLMSSTSIIQDDSTHSLLQDNSNQLEPSYQEIAEEVPQATNSLPK